MNNINRNVDTEPRQASTLAFRGSPLVVMGNRVALFWFIIDTMLTKLWNLRKSFIFLAIGLPKNQNKVLYR